MADSRSGAGHIYEGESGKSRHIRKEGSCPRLMNEVKRKSQPESKFLLTKDGTT